MLERGRRWVSLGRAAKLLGMHYRTLLGHLEDPDGGGFTVLEHRARNGKRIRYLPMDEIKRAMGETPVASSEGD